MIFGVYNKTPLETHRPRGEFDGHKLKDVSDESLFKIHQSFNEMMTYLISDQGRCYANSIWLTLAESSAHSQV